MFILGIICFALGLGIVSVLANLACESDNNFLEGLLIIGSFLFGGAGMYGGIYLIVLGLCQ